MRLVLFFEIVYNISMFYLYNNDPEVGANSFLPCFTQGDADFFICANKTISPGCFNLDFDNLDSSVETENSQLITQFQNLAEQYALSPYWGKYIQSSEHRDILDLIFELSCCYNPSIEAPITKGTCFHHYDGRLFLYVSDNVETGHITVLELIRIGIKNTWEPKSIEAREICSGGRILPLPVDSDEILLFYEPTIHAFHPEIELF